MITTFLSSKFLPALICLIQYNKEIRLIFGVFKWILSFIGLGFNYIIASRELKNRNLITPKLIQVLFLLKLFHFSKIQQKNRCKKKIKRIFYYQIKKSHLYLSVLDIRKLKVCLYKNFEDKLI